MPSPLGLLNLDSPLQSCLLEVVLADSSMQTVRLNGEGSKLELNMESFQISMRWLGCQFILWSRRFIVQLSHTHASQQKNKVNVQAFTWHAWCDPFYLLATMAQSPIAGLQPIATFPARKDVLTCADCVLLWTRCQPLQHSQPLYCMRFAQWCRRRIGLPYWLEYVMCRYV